MLSSTSSNEAFHPPGSVPGQASPGVLPGCRRANRVERPTSCDVRVPTMGVVLRPRRGSRAYTALRGGLSATPFPQCTCGAAWTGPPTTSAASASADFPFSDGAHRSPCLLLLLAFRFRGCPLIVRTSLFLPGCGPAAGAGGAGRAGFPLPRRPCQLFRAVARSHVVPTNARIWHRRRRVGIAWSAAPSPGWSPSWLDACVR
jgi:hypothetical protein